MASAEEIMDAYSGMISKSDAEKIAGSIDVKGQSVFDAKAVIEMAGKQIKNPKLLEIDVQDEVYRIFNQPVAKEGAVRWRTVVLGKEGDTISLELRGRLSASIDFGKFERGDTIMVNRALLDTKKLKIVSFTDTTIGRVKRSANGVVELKGVAIETKNVDVSGKVTVMSQPREIPKIGSKGNTAVIDCTISQDEISADVTMWGSSAYAFIDANPNIGDIIKIEFCNIKPVEGKLRIVANDSSRVLLLKRNEKLQDISHKG